MEKTSAEPGEFLIIGRQDDTNEISVARIEGLGRRMKLSDLCQRVLLEMGMRDPLVYEFLALVYAPRRGGAQVVLTQSKLRRYVYARWGPGT